MVDLSLGSDILLIILMSSFLEISFYYCLGWFVCCLSMGKLNNPGVKPVITAIYGVLTQFQAFQGN